jgi:hypothetical protein
MQHALSATDKTEIEQQTQFSQMSHEEDQDERRRTLLPDFALPIGPMGFGQPPASPVPLVQGTPQARSVPLVQGTPSLPAGSSLPQGGLYGEAQSPAPTYPAQQTPLPHTGQQPFQMHVSQPPPHVQPVTSPPYHPEEPSRHHTRKRQAHRKHKIHHTASYAPKMVGGFVTKWLIIGLIGMIVIGAGGVGFAIYLLTRPEPTITINSNYTLGATPAGATGTTLHVSGNKFSGTSTITFLLDGAPPDNASFTLNLSIHSRVDTLGTQYTHQATLLITGHPDPTGGTVCRSRDNGRPQVYSGVTIDTGEPFTETFTESCNGSYKGGKITFTETLTSDKIVFTSSNPLTTCTLNGPHVDLQLAGSYTAQHVFSGTISYPEVPRSAYTCNNPNSYFFYYAEHGTWTGQIAP